MCQAFSCLVDQAKKVTWKFGMDSHTELIKLAGYQDQTADPQLMTFARVEITPDGNTWRLHGGKDAKVLFEISQEKLKGASHD